MAQVIKFSTLEDKAIWMEKALLADGVEEETRAEKFFNILLAAAPDIFSAAMAAPTLVANLQNFADMLNPAKHTLINDFFSQDKIVERVKDHAIDGVKEKITDKLSEAYLGGHGVFDRELLEKKLTVAEKKLLKEKGCLLKSIGSAGWILLGALTCGTGPAGPALAGFILVSGALRYLINADRLEKARRWEKIVASMMAKYTEILRKAAEKKLKVKEMLDEVEKKRYEFETTIENKVVTSFEVNKRQVTVTQRQLERLGVYAVYGLDEHLSASADNVILRGYLYLSWKSSIDEFYNAKDPLAVNKAERTARKAKVREVSNARDYQVFAKEGKVGAVLPTSNVHKFIAKPDDDKWMDDEIFEDVSVDTSNVTRDLKAKPSSRVSNPVKN